MHLRESQFERAGELFYEAAAVPDSWPEALQALADAAGAMGANLLPVRPGPDAAVCSPNIRGLMDEFIAGRWLRINPYMRRGLQLTRAGWKGLITSEDMLGPDAAAHDPYVNEFETPRGFGPKAGLVLASAGEELALPMTIERGLAAGPFSKDELAKMNRLVAMLQPAAQLALKVGFSASQRVADALAGIGKDAILLGGSGRVLYLPTGAEDLIDDALTLVGGVLSSWNGDTARRLETAIARAVSAEAISERVVRSVALPRRGGERPIVAQIVPIFAAAHDVFMLARAVVILTGAAAAGPTDAVRGSLTALGLSMAEARLAHRIAQGEKLKDIAETEGVTLETARTRLKSVFAKTDTHRQAELAVLVTGLLH